MFNPQKLTLARKRRRLSSKDLAKLIDVSPVTISRLEKANNNPDPETLDALAKALRFPKAFFFGDDIDDLTKDAASFRSLTSMTAKERDSALSAARIGYQLSDWVEKKFNLPELDLIDLGHEKDPKKAAKHLRQYWGLGEKPISNMIKLLESKGILVFSLIENTKNVDAFSCWRNNKSYVFLNTFKSAEHSRFDAAHELGHLVLHKHGGPGGREAEHEANSFAASFLMPKADVISTISFVRSIDQLIKAKKRWRVSVFALAHRLHKLDILSDWQYRGFCIDYRKYRTQEPNGIEKEESVLWKKVFSELWKEKITKTDIAKTLHLPEEEIENLVFGLTNYNADKLRDNSSGRLRLVK